VTGDVLYRTLEIQLGAVVQGRLVHQEGDAQPKVVALKPAQPTLSTTPSASTGD
jgi:cytoskeletal protein CcmA (bactofilin family)